MQVDRFNYKIETLRDRLTVLSHSTDEVSGQQQQLLADYLEDLQTSCEEIHIAWEVLRQQNEELAIARQTAELELKRYKDLFEFAPDGYLVTDPHGTIQKANRAAAMLLKTSQECLAGKSLISFVPQEDQRGFRSQLTCLCKVGPIQEWELRLRPSDDAFFDAAVTVATVRDDQDNAIALHWLLRDITERKWTEVIKTKVRVLESMVEGVNVSDENGIIFFTNPALDAMFGYEPGELLGKHLSVLNAHSSQENAQILSTMISQLQSQGAWAGELNNLKKDGTPFTTYARSSVLEISGKRYGVSVLEDITERKHAEKALIEKEAFLRLVLDNIPQFIFWKDRNSVYQGCNRNFALVAGLSIPEEIVGKTDYDLPWTKEESDWFRQNDAQVIETDTAQYHIIEPLLQADGQKAWLDTNKIPLHDAQGNVVGVLGSYENITERQLAQEKIRYQAMHDLLTGLPNRTQFNDRLSLSLAVARHRQNMLAVMFLDLDRFKTINDTLGHAVGDRLLQEVASRLKSCLREKDTVARWGGDEFTLLVPHISCAEDAAQIAQRILAALKPALHLEEQSQACRTTSLHISTSIGIALYPQNGSDAETLLRNADAALYRAKQQGRNNYQFYTEEMNSQACDLLVLENQLHQALTRREFLVYYQPQVNTTTGEITGMEALLRWQHPQLGLVSPNTFIPIAEETGLIVPIGEWVLQTACAQNKAWHDAGFPPLCVTVNLSARQFQQPHLLNFVAQTLQQTGLSPEFLELEITEMIAMKDVEFTKTILSQLHQLGVHLSIDGFGTKYSLLAYLKQFPLHTLKIDKSFVQEVINDSQNAGIINAILTLGKGFNLRVVAEGVETEAQNDCLRSFQCEQIQGYLSSPPLPAQEATQLLRNSRSTSGKISISNVPRGLPL